MTFARAKNLIRSTIPEQIVERINISIRIGVHSPELDHMIFVLTIDLKRVYTICTFLVLVAVQVEQHHPHGHQMPGCAGRCHDVAATIVL